MSSTTNNVSTVNTNAPEALKSPRKALQTQNTAQPEAPKMKRELAFFEEEDLEENANPFAGSINPVAPKPVYTSSPVKLRPYVHPSAQNFPAQSVPTQSVQAQKAPEALEAPPRMLISEELAKAHAKVIASRPPTKAYRTPAPPSMGASYNSLVNLLYY